MAGLRYILPASRSIRRLSGPGVYTRIRVLLETGLTLGRQFGRRADEHRDVVTGGERLTQHVAAQRSGRTQDDDAGHQNPTFSGNGRAANAPGCASARPRFSSKCHFQIS
jgi:hypothetical protein